MDFTPKHARAYANVGDVIHKAVSEYVGDVGAGEVPCVEKPHSGNEAQRL